VYSQLLYTNFPNTREFCSLLQRPHVDLVSVPLYHQQLYSWRNHAIWQEKSNTSWTVRVCRKASFHTASEGLLASIVTAGSNWSSLSTNCIGTAFIIELPALQKFGGRATIATTLDTAYCRSYTSLIQFITHSALSPFKINCGNQGADRQTKTNRWVVFM